MSKPRGKIDNWADMDESDDEEPSNSSDGSLGLKPIKIIDTPPAGPSWLSPDEMQYGRIGYSLSSVLNQCSQPTRDRDDYSGGRRPDRDFGNGWSREMNSRADEVDNWGKTKKPISSNLGSRFPGSVQEPNWSRRDERFRKERLTVAAPSPFGGARPREEVLAERGIDWKKLDLEIEAKKTANRPETERERILKEEREHLKEEIEHLKEETEHVRTETEGLKEEIESLKKRLEDETTAVSNSSLENTVLLDLETLRREICTQLLPFFWMLSCAVFLFVLIISLFQTFLGMNY